MYTLLLLPRGVEASPKKRKAVHDREGLKMCSKNVAWALSDDAKPKIFT